MLRSLSVIVTMVGMLGAPSAALAQRGMGDTQGVARQTVLPDLVDLAGTVSEVVIDKCAMTTGRAGVGAHVILSTPDGNPINLHLGPEVALPDLLAVLTPKAGVTTTAFRTDVMPADAYVAQAVTVDDETFILRDAQTLRPGWQIGPGGGGHGQGMGMGPGQGRGGGRGGGAGQGWWSGGGTGSGAGSAQGMGRCWW